jgi:cohesin complex subunit SA-1/2
MSLYSDDSNISSVRAFTLRVTPRLIQIALRDIDNNVRVAAILVLTAIEKAELLSEDDEEGRERVAWLIFDEEVKIERAIGEMVKIIWSDLKEDEQKAYQSKTSKKAGGRRKKQQNATAEDQDGVEALAEDEVDIRFGWKALATLLVKTSKDLDEATNKAASASDSQQDNQATLVTMDDIAATVSATSLKGPGVHRRAVAAVESLWNEIEQVQKWDTLVAFLLLDHSEADGDVGSWALEEEEESFLISMLLAILERTASEAASKKVRPLGSLC